MLENGQNIKKPLANCNFKMKIFAFIFARGGSKGIKNKNTKTFAGKPLLYHSIKFAKKMKFINKVFVSSEDKKILKIAKKNKASIINRPKNLAGDKSPEWLSWRHAIKYLNKKKFFFDIMLIIPCTAPLRSRTDIVKCIKKLNRTTDIVVTKTDTSRHPAFNMVQLNKKGNLKPYISSKKIFTRRQDLPKIYNLCTVAYVTRPKYVLKKEHIFQGKVNFVNIPQSRSIDIDSETDFKIAELLFKKRHNKYA